MTLTRRLLLLALISVLPAIAIWTYTEVSLRRAREAEISDQVIRQAKLAGSELERVFDGIHSLLIAVDETPSIRGFNTLTCNAYLKTLQQKVPHVLSFVVLDLDGDVRCQHSDVQVDRSYKERSYFRDALATQQFVVGQYTQEFAEGGLGSHPVLPLALPVWSSSGLVIGVLAAALDLNWLDQKLKERALPAGGSLTIADSSGIIIAREPFPEKYIGLKISDGFVNHVREGGTEAIEIATLDGVKQILGYVAVKTPPHDIYVSLGLSWKAAFDAINRAASRGFILIAAALVLALSLSQLTSRGFITKPFETMTNSVRAWRRGNYQARINPRGAPAELRVLAQAFNDLMDDVAERQQALQTSEEQARLALDAGHMGTWWYDHVKGLGGLSAQAALLLGLPAEKTTVDVPQWRCLVHPEDAERVLAKMKASVMGNGHYEDEFRVRHPDGEVRWINSKGRVFFDARRRPIHFVGIFQDITERRQAEDQQQFLLGELNHRVKNTLTTVQSIASQTLRSVPDLAHFKEAFEGRLLALSKTHDLLTRNSWREADLRDIAEQELAPYRKKGDERVIIDGPHVKLPTRYAINLGLVLHELVTNAVKYGALSSASGELELKWSIMTNGSPQRQIRCQWGERGGPPVQAPRHQGFGSRLIRRSIEGELSGHMTLQFAATGVVYDFTIPLP
ncbi:sensor histidine kinase [Microvirga sp. 2TAF3]|uniref:sensor histidine kinase n=1 Tax=Microvirga sp. 2TAF3 TaxID=3233014 RepID=UPI003F9A95DC